jgi:hypothetical protein
MDNSAPHHLCCQEYCINYYRNSSDTDAGRISCSRYLEDMITDTVLISFRLVKVHLQHM